MTFISQVAGVAAKDLRIEIRARYGVGVVLPFGATVLIAFGLSLGPGRTLLEETAPGLLWIAILFAAVFSFVSSYESEGEDDALEGILLSPIDWAAVFLGKVAAVVLQLLVLEAAVVSLTLVLFGISLRSDVFLLVGTFFLGSVGLSAIGCLACRVPKLSASARSSWQGRTAHRKHQAVGGCLLVAPGHPASARGFWKA